MRFLAAAWVGMLQCGAWLANARHANAMAELLERRLREVPGTDLLHRREANSVFVGFPAPLVEAMHERGWHFYGFIGGASRLMCSWDTTPDDVQAFVYDVRELVGASAPGSREQP